MADNHSKEVRSMNMSHIRSKDTKPEIIVRSFLHRKGFRFRKMINGILVNLMLYCLNIKPQSISMGVFGMCTIVIILYGPNQTQNIGRISLLITKNVTKNIMTK